MTSEFSPGGGSARMTKAQVKRYIADMKKAQLIAQKKLEEARKRGDFKEEEDEVNRLSKLLDDDSIYN